MNIFEGSRRILKVIYIGIVIGFGIAALYIKPVAYLRYQIDSPTSVPMRIDNECPDGSTTELLYLWTKKNTHTNVLLCFTSSTFKEVKTGKDIQLIPYKYDPEKKQTWGGAPYSEEVYAYKQSVKKSFTLPPMDEELADKRYWPLFFKEAAVGFGFMCLLLAATWGFFWTVGWVVRGFMGIPRGKDSKPKEIP